MLRFLNICLVNTFFLVFAFIQFSFSEEKNIYDILDIIQKDSAIPINPSTLYERYIK